jgi:hypothetical protein
LQADCCLAISIYVLIVPIESATCAGGCLLLCRWCQQQATTWTSCRYKKDDKPINTNKKTAISLSELDFKPLMMAILGLNM